MSLRRLIQRARGRGKTDPESQAPQEREHAQAPSVSSVSPLGPFREPRLYGLTEEEALRAASIFSGLGDPRKEQ